MNRALIHLFLFLMASCLGFIVHAEDLWLDGGAEDGWNKKSWKVLLDGVMGGKSSGTLSFKDDDATLVFTGDINLEGGGFSSIQKDFREFMTRKIDLRPYAGIVVELETPPDVVYPEHGSPMGVQMSLEDDSIYSYASAFAVPLTSSEGTVTSIYMPIESFDRGSRFGFLCSNNCKLDIGNVKRMVIYMLFQKGPFEVRIRSIYAVEKPISFPSPILSLSSTDDVKNIIDATIMKGGGLYDYGYPELCMAMYGSSLNTLLAASFTDDLIMTDLMRGMICEGLTRTVTQTSKIDAAFTLRYTMDALLEELGAKDPMPLGEAGSDVWRPDPATASDMAYECKAVTSFEDPMMGLRNMEPTFGQVQQGTSPIVLYVGAPIIAVLLGLIYYLYKKQEKTEYSKGKGEPGSDESTAGSKSDDEASKQDDREMI